LTYRIRARADQRALSVGLALGAAVGLVLGGAYAAGGMAQAADAHAAAQRAARSGQPQPLAGKPAQVAVAALTPLAVTRVSTAPARPFHLAEATSRDLDCLADAVYYEARGESVAGQAAVAQVVLNRVRHPQFPKTVCGVVFQGVQSADCQFSFACDGSMDQPKDRAAWARAEQIAARALAGVVMPQVGQATHFHVVGVQPEWGPSLMRVAQVGLHVFYRLGGHGGARFDGLVRPSGPGADAPHAVYASMLPGLGIGGDDSAPKPALSAVAASPAAPTPAQAAPAVVQAAAPANPAAKTGADTAAAKPAQVASVS
jgi:spore germination cell wall hydrolase CwlJ-like protein